MGSCNCISSSTAPSSQLEVLISSVNIDNELCTVSLEQWKKQIRQQKENMYKRSQLHVQLNDYDELISCLQTPSKQATSNNIIAIIARLISAYSGNIIVVNVCNDTQNHQIKLIISMAIDPTTFDIYLADSNTIFKVIPKQNTAIESKLSMSNTFGDCDINTNKHMKKQFEETTNTYQLIPIFRLPYQSKKLFELTSFIDCCNYNTAQITDICIDSNGQYLFYVINDNYWKIFLINIDKPLKNIDTDIDIDPEENNAIANHDQIQKTQFKSSTKEEYYTNHLYTIDKSCVPYHREWIEYANGKTLLQCNFNNIYNHSDSECKSIYDSCRNVIWIAMKDHAKPWKYSPKNKIHERIAVEIPHILVCLKDNVKYDYTEVSLHVPPPNCKSIVRLQYEYTNLRLMYDKKSVGTLTSKSTNFKHKIRYGNIIKQYCEKYCTICNVDSMPSDKKDNDNNDGDVKKNNDGDIFSSERKKKAIKLCQTIIKAGYNFGFIESGPNIKDILMEWRCLCHDFLKDITAFTIDKYCNSVYIILQNNMLYKLEYNLDKNLNDWKVTNRVNLQEKIEFSLDFVEYDSVNTRLILCDHNHVQALYI